MLEIVPSIHMVIYGLNVLATSVATVRMSMALALSLSSSQASLPKIDLLLPAYSQLLFWSRSLPHMGSILSACSNSFKIEIWPVSSKNVLACVFLKIHKCTLTFRDTFFFNLLNRFHHMTQINRSRFHLLFLLCPFSSLTSLGSLMAQG